METVLYKHEDKIVDEWWAGVDPHRYPRLTHPVKVALSSFHGPLVESSFSIMTEMVDQRNTGIEIKTFAAIQTVKHSLKVARKKSI